MRDRHLLAIPVFLLLVGGALSAAAQTPGQAPPSHQQTVASSAAEDRMEILSLRQALISLPLAGVLGALLAFRPHRKGLRERRPEVIQTQIVLALVGALIMLVIGASLARAFGIAGAASLVRYRSKIDDPKDASVMLSALAIGLASGVGLFYLAIGATLFIVAVLWGLEWLEPQPVQLFTLKIKSKTDLKPRVEALLKRSRLKAELRSSADGEICYEVEVPEGKETEPLLEAIVAFDKVNPPAVEWQEKKAPKG
jgi:hypothetical protein